MKPIITALLLLSTIQADKIGACLKDPKTVWDIQAWRCVKATAEELPYAKG